MIVISNNIAIVILTIVVFTLLLVWYRRVARLECAYTSTQDSFAIWKGRLCKCSFPSKYAKVVGSVDVDECLEIGADGLPAQCDDATLVQQCDSRLFFLADNELMVCRGRNVKPVAISSNLGIGIDGDGNAIPNLDCTTPAPTRDARVWFARPACVDQYYSETPTHINNRRAVQLAKI